MIAMAKFSAQIVLLAALLAVVQLAAPAAAAGHRVLLKHHSSKKAKAGSVKAAAAHGGASALEAQQLADQKAQLAALVSADNKILHHQAAGELAKAKAALPERHVVELVVTIASYNCVSRVLEALEINGADPL